MSNDSLIRKSIPLATPDYDSIKDSLRLFLKSKEELSDFEFEGAVMTVLVELLSYNSHAKAFYLNMVGNEAFLSTAIKRDSVVGRAQDLGYEAKSDIAARAVLDVNFKVSDPVVERILVERNTVFSSSGVNFVTADSGVVSRNLSTNAFEGTFEVFQGKSLTFRYTYTKTQNEIGFMLPNENVDTTKLRILVNENDVSNRFVEFVKVDRLFEVSENSNVYFLFERNGLYYIQFGNGFFGKELPENSKIVIEYLSTSGVSGNGLKDFTLSSELAFVDEAVVTVREKAAGGKSKESIESIKFNAPRVRQAQNRAVTETDYEIVAMENIADAAGAVAWGGERATPPEYGVIFIAIKPQGGLFYTEEEKRSRLSIIRRFSVAGLVPKIVDPDYLFIRMETTVYYSRIETGLTTTDITAKVRSQISKYTSEQINGVDKGFRRSEISRYIGAADVSVKSSTIDYYVEKRILFFINKRKSLTVDFSFPIDPNSLRSSSFTYKGIESCSFRSTNGILDIYANENLIQSNVGMVTAAGIVSVNTLEYDEIDQFDVNIGVPYISFYVDTDLQEIDSGARSFLELQVDKITVLER